MLYGWTNLEYTMDSYWYNHRGWRLEYITIFWPSGLEECLLGGGLRCNFALYLYTKLLGSSRCRF